MDPDDNLYDSIRTAVINTCDSWDIHVHDVTDIRITGVTDADKDKYEISVPVSGRILFKDLLDDQGTLLYMKNDIEIHLKGMLDDRLLLEATLHG